MILSPFSRVRRYFLSFRRNLTPAKFRNFLRVEGDLRRGRAVCRGYPYILKIETTNHCNLHCPLCYAGRKKHDFEGARGFGTMSLEDFKDIIGQLGTYLFRADLYGYGEPLMDPHLFDRIAHLTASRVGSAIASNFLLSDRKTAGELIRTGLEHLIISMDGTDQKSYETYKVGGDFARVIENIRIMQEEKKRQGSALPLLDWQFVIMRHNEAQIPKARAMAAELGIAIRFKPLGSGGEKKETFLRWVPENDPRFKGTSARAGAAERRCSLLYRTTFINWDRNVSPCCNYFTGDCRFDFGSLAREPFSAIWNNPIYQAARRGKAPGGMPEEGAYSICFGCPMMRGGEGMDVPAPVKGDGPA
jgi:MoaA/NifB/PqqE/SkfB family radical SAM enzyme